MPVFSATQHALLVWLELLQMSRLEQVVEVSPGQLKSL